MTNKEYIESNGGSMTHGYRTAKLATIIGVLSRIVFVLILVTAGLAITDVYVTNYVIGKGNELLTVIVALLAVALSFVELAINLSIVRRIHRIVNKDKKQVEEDLNAQFGKVAVEVLKPNHEDEDEDEDHEDDIRSDEFKSVNLGGNDFTVFRSGKIINEKTGNTIGYMLKGHKYFQYHDKRTGRKKTVNVSTLIFDVFKD